MTKIEQILNEKLIYLGAKTMEIERTIDKLHLQRFTLNKKLEELNKKLEELAITEQVYEQDLRLVMAQAELLESVCSEIEYENEQAATGQMSTEDFKSFSARVDEKGNNKSEGFNAETHLVLPIQWPVLPWPDKFRHMTQEERAKYLTTPELDETLCKHDCACCDHFPDPPIAPTSCAGCFHTYESGCPGKTTPCSQFEQYNDEDEYKTICDDCRLAYTGECSDMDLCVSDCINFISVYDQFEDAENMSPEDSAIQTAEDLANTIAEKDKPKSLVLAQLVLFSDDNVEDAICSAIGEYAANCPQSHFSRFYVRAFIDHLENNLGGNCDVDYETAVLALEMNKGVTKVYESVWERLN